jgi:hypothetical protein
MADNKAAGSTAPVAPAGSQTENLPNTQAVAPAPGAENDNTGKGDVFLRTAYKSDRFVYEVNKDDPSKSKAVDGNYQKFSQTQAKRVRELAAANGVRLLEKSA